MMRFACAEVAALVMALTVAGCGGLSPTANDSIPAVLSQGERAPGPEPLPRAERSPRPPQCSDTTPCDGGYLCVDHTCVRDRSLGGPTFARSVARAHREGGSERRLRCGVRSRCDEGYACVSRRCVPSGT